eukprot:12665172-Ditylum_brightwellii.AAC.1
MGISSSEQLIWTAKKLNVAQLREAVQCLKGSDGIIQIGIDCSWIACSMVRGKSPSNMVQYIVNFLLTIARKILAVITLDLDGVSCHHCKRVSTKHVAQWEKNRIESAVAHYSVLALSLKVDREEGTEEERRKDRA